ncbi:nitrous oxide reductase accessory protein NosL [Ferruginibacter sp. SUN002]|uniref:nitrous oxide reductase accessory protein NosL n=1 Tax=Ferruginibacter sp. SUN002 TaxID=2937789 RepID=UPI003D3695CC
MQTARIQNWVRLVLILCGVALIAVLFVPMWRIDLDAPQYPEGLKLLIYPNKLAGNVDIINGLNHYIGMKTLHANDFIEFTVLPYIIGLFAALFILFAIIGKRKWINLLLILFILFGVVAMYDFWRWEYDYGHNLNPDAAIIVPGMAYQPPLIGFKQLLNFGAYSVPDIGGWIFIGAGALLFLCVVAEWRLKKISSGNSVVAALLFLSFSLSSCSIAPEPLKIGVDNCYFCKMTVSDVKFGAELITTKGKIHKFDDIHCILAYLKTKETPTANIKDIYLANFSGDHQLINVNKSFLLKSETLRSPMGGNIAAFDSKDNLIAVQKSFPGTIVTWTELIKQ